MFLLLLSVLPLSTLSPPSLHSQSSLFALSVSSLFLPVSAPLLSMSTLNTLKVQLIEIIRKIQRAGL